MIFLTGSLALSTDSILGIYNGLFHSTVTTQSFDLFVYIIGAMILLLTGFSPRRLIELLVKPVLGLLELPYVCYTHYLVGGGGSGRPELNKNLYYRLRGTVEYKKIYEK